MFPPLSVELRGLEEDAQYAVSLELHAVGGRWRRAGGTWTEVAHTPAVSPPPHTPRAALHPDAPASRSRWHQPFTFKHVKLTNNIHDTSGNVSFSNYILLYKPLQ
jgi:hypothetical protein